MIVLDTNVVSESLKPRPNPTVMSWLDKQVRGRLFLSAVSLSELQLGVELLDEGRRKVDLARRQEVLLNQLFENRVLPFRKQTALLYASFMAQARRRGITVEVPHGQIAATAKEHGFRVATRDEMPFRAAELQVINPWSE